MDVNQKKFFFFLILFNIILRVTASYFFGDTEVHMEWGRLVHNLNLTGVLGINVVLNEHIASPAYAVSGQIVLPSVFMPPLYAYYIFLLIGRPPTVFLSRSGGLPPLFLPSAA